MGNSSFILPYIFAIRAMRSVPVDDIAEAVEVRMRKQGVLHMPGKGFFVVIEESVLHSCIIDPEAMIARARLPALMPVAVATLVNT